MTIPLTQIRWGGSYFPVECFEQIDSAGAVVINSADQPYDPQGIARNYDTINVEFYTTSLSLPLRATWVNTVNLNAWWGFLARQLQIAKWEFKLFYDVDTTPYVQNRAELWVKLPNWDEELPDYGTVEKVSSTGDPEVDYEPILFKGGIPGTNLMLDGSGGVATSQTVPSSNIHPRHKPFDFSTTPLPATLPVQLQ